QGRRNKTRLRGLGQVWPTSSPRERTSLRQTWIEIQGRAFTISSGSLVNISLPLRRCRFRECPAGNQQMKTPARTPEKPEGGRRPLHFAGTGNSETLKEIENVNQVCMPRRDLCLRGGGDALALGREVACPAPVRRRE